MPDPNSPITSMWDVFAIKDRPRDSSDSLLKRQGCSLVVSIAWLLPVVVSNMLFFVFIFFPLSSVIKSVNSSLRI